MDDPIIDDASIDETEFDKSLESDLAALRNEQPLTPPAEVKTETPIVTPAKVEVPVEIKVESPVPAPVAAESASVVPPKVEDSTFRVPVKGPSESEETYQVRVELFKLIDARTKAKTPEEKQALTQKIGETRQEMRTIGAKEGIKNPNGDVPVLQKSEEDIKAEAKIETDKAYLKKIGAVTQEDLAAE